MQRSTVPGEVSVAVWVDQRIFVRVASTSADLDDDTSAIGSNPTL
jgi:hypothetical protein